VLAAALAVVAAALAAPRGDAATVTLPPGTIPVPTAGSFLYLNSQPGDYIGQGEERLWVEPSSVVDGSLVAPWLFFGGGGGYGVELQAPSPQALAVGSYAGATRYPFNPPGTPGLNVSGNGRGCNTLTGSFDVDELTIAPTGEVLVFQATFEQHCEGASAPALFGRIRIERAPPTPGVTLPPGTVTLPTTGSYLYFNSQPGDYIGAGREHLYTSADTTFTATLPSGGGLFSASAIQGDFDHWWYVDVAAPAGEALAAGSYIRAERWPFQASGRPGLSISGDGRGCNTLTGKFDVDELVRGPAGELLVFQATFEQHCEGGRPALFGRIRIDNRPPPPVESTCGNVQGNGFLREQPDTRFELGVRYKRGAAAPTGEIALADRETGAVRFASTSLRQLAIDGNTATVTGAGVAGGAPVTFTLRLVDGRDALTLELSNGESFAGTLKHGRIEIHHRC
jgi:hypothetical protein